jgi:rRNA maturation protein Rpf1
MSFKDLSLLASQHKAKYVMLVARWKGGPGKIEFYKPLNRELKLLSPLIYLKGVKLQREYQVRWDKLKIAPLEVHMVKPLSGEATKLAEALSGFFGVQRWVDSPEEPIRGRIYVEILRLKDQSLKITFYSTVNSRLVEIGPALKFRHLIWSVEKPGKS